MIRFDFNPSHVNPSVFSAVADEADGISSSSNVMVQGASIAVYMPRTFARPQDRWLDAALILKPSTDLHNTRIEARLFAFGERDPLAMKSVVPTTEYGLISIDMRRENLAAAELTLEYFEGDERTGLARMLLSAQMTTNPLSSRRPAINIDIPAEHGVVRAWPVVFGVPFPRGTLWDVAELRLVNGAGSEIPAQREIMARWSREGAVQWVRFDALVNSGEEYFIEAAMPVSEPEIPVSVMADEDCWVLDTGPARYVLGRGQSPVEEIWLDGARVAGSSGARGLYVVDQAGRTAYAASETVLVEAQGPIAACIRFEGFYRTVEGQPLARHITRVEGFAGQPFIRLTHTLVLTEDTREIWLREAGWEFTVMPGANARAVFNIARDTPGETLSYPLNGSVPVYMLQREHERFRTGTNHFTVSSGENILAAGEECGDWAMLAGDAGALMFACRDAARQHPKEFEIFSDRIVLKLFSDRAGEELDLRSATLVEKWNLDRKIAEEAAQLDLNAAGWSKTHELTFAPLGAPVAEETAARISALHSRPVYALADPEWIRFSGAMGPLHPRDRVDFPEVEDFIDRVCRTWIAGGHKPGHYGFVDYFAGPTYGGQAGFCRAGRYRYTYGIRPGIWLFYARSGERAARDFAEGSNKAYMDNWITHWEVPDKVRGLYSGIQGGITSTKLPFYWGKGTAFQISSSTDLNQYLWLYYLTGYRRAADVVTEFGEGLKRAWQPATRPGRVLMTFRALVQCYGFAWDQHLRALAEGTFDVFTDMEGELLLTKDRPYNSSTYKTQVDLRAVIEGWNLFGEPRYREVALALSRHWWHNHVGGTPITYMNPLGICGDFLYGQTGDPAIPAGLDFVLRRASRHTAGVGPSAAAAAFESLPYAMDVVGRAPPARPSWIAFNDYGWPASVLVNKSDKGILDLTVRSAVSELGRQFELRSVGISDVFGHDLTSVLQKSAGAATARVPKDAPAGCYEIIPSARGEQFVLAARPVPMVLHAANYWALPDVSPAPRVYFNLPPASRAARIFFEGRARLFTPDGQVSGTADGVRGWVNLPADKPGLWSFEPIENRLVRGRNFPPFYAFHAPENYFEPPVEWKTEEPVTVSDKPPPSDVVFVAGAIDAPADQALFLDGERTFQFPAGLPHPDGDGGRFLPYRQGTVEFFFKPYWSTFDLGEGSVQRSFVRILTDKRPWQLIYRLDPDGVDMNLCPPDPSHSFLGEMYLNNPGRPEWLRVWRTQTILEHGEWMHVAWSWGPELVDGPRGNKINLMTMRIFVNGRGVHWRVFRRSADALAEGQPETFVFDPVNGAVDELRVSDIQRYQENFTPPAHDREFTMDENTRALFHFNGSLEGQSHGAPASVIGVID